MLKDKMITWIKFGLVGSMNTFIDVAIFTILSFIGVQYIAAQCVSYLAGVLNSYFLNRNWTFKRKEKANLQEFALFLTVNLITLAVTVLLFPLIHQNLGWGLIWSKLAVTVVGVVINFIGSKLIVFKKEDSDYLKIMKS